MSGCAPEARTKKRNRIERNDKMAKTNKPTHTPSLRFPSAADTLHQEGHWLWIPIRKEWRDVTTKLEEIVRQKFIRTLVEHYGYALEQLVEGVASARATAVAKRAEATTLRQSA
jgi:hypothetical protein